MEVFATPGRHHTRPQGCRPAVRRNGGSAAPKPAEPRRWTGPSWSTCREVRPTHPGPALAATGLPASTQGPVRRRRRGAAGLPDILERLAHRAGEVGSHLPSGPPVRRRQRPSGSAPAKSDSTSTTPMTKPRSRRFVRRWATDRAWAEGAALSVDEAVAYAQPGRAQVTHQHCSPRAVRTPVATRNLNPDKTVSST